MQEAADWEAKGFLCKLAGGTEAPDFVLEPSRGDAFGGSREYHAEGSIDRLRMNDTSSESGDEVAELLMYITDDADPVAEFENEPLSAFSAYADKEDIEKGSVAPKEFEEGRNVQNEIDLDEETHEEEESQEAPPQSPSSKKKSSGIGRDRQKVVA